MTYGFPARFCCLEFRFRHLQAFWPSISRSCYRFLPRNFEVRPLSTIPSSKKIAAMLKTFYFHLFTYFQLRASKKGPFNLISLNYLYSFNENMKRRKLQCFSCSFTAYSHSIYHYSTFYLALFVIFSLILNPKITLISYNLNNTYVIVNLILYLIFNLF